MENERAHSNICLKMNSRRYFIIVFALFSGWLLSFPFQGRVYYSIMEANNIDGKQLAILVLLAHLVGLVSSGIFTKSIKKAYILIRITLVLNGFLSLVCLLAKGEHLVIILPFIGFVAGTCLASFGYYFHITTPSGERFRTAADLLIASNILMIFLNGMTMFISPEKSLVLAIFPLVIAYILMGKLYIEVGALTRDIKKITKTNKSLMGQSQYRLRALIVLFLFIVIVTIDSGLMYSVITPSFTHLEVLSLWYWGVPYLAALIILRNLPRGVDRTISLFIAISMIGLAFLGFIILEKTAYTFILVNTLMMGAFGIFDLFWWSILGEMLDEWNNKAAIFGIGLGVNILGIIVGESLAVYISQPEIVALAVVFVGLVVLPLMNQQLTAYRSDFAFFSKGVHKYQAQNEFVIASTMDIMILSRREQEILPCLLRGDTNRIIAGCFNLSENTVKTHIKNIYGKLEVSSRTELLHLFLEKPRE